MCPHYRNHLSWVGNDKHIMQPVSCPHKQPQWQSPLSWMSLQHICALLHTISAHPHPCCHIPTILPCLWVPMIAQNSAPAPQAAVSAAPVPKPPRHCLSSLQARLSSLIPPTEPQLPGTSTPACWQVYEICRNFALWEHLFTVKHEANSQKASLGRGHRRC